MSKFKKSTSFLLALIIVLQLFGAAPQVFAADAVDEDASVSWAVTADTGHGEETLTTTEQVKDKLGKGFSVYFGKNSDDEPITAPKVKTLRKNGVKLTPPTGYELKSVFIIADGGSLNEGSKSLLNIAAADTSGKFGATLGKWIFAENFNASEVGTVFNNKGKGASKDSYTIWIALEKASVEDNVRIDYTVGDNDALRSLLGGSSVAEGGDHLSLDIDEDRGFSSFIVSDVSSAAADLALNSLGAKFTGWRLTYPNGSSALVSAGAEAAIRSSVTLDAEWQGVITFSFESASKEYDGTPLTVDYTCAAKLADGDRLVVPDEALTVSITNAANVEATVDRSQVKVLHTDANGKESDVTSKYEIIVYPGTISISRRPLTIQIGSRSKDYDGVALEPNAYEITYGSVVEGHELSVSYTGSQTVPGTGVGSALLSICDQNGSDVTANYDVSVYDGDLVVDVRSEKQSLTVKVSDSSKEYDGSELRAEGFDIVEGSLLGSDELRLVSSGAGITGIGSVSSSAEFAVMNGDTDVSENYDITVLPGILKVEHRRITLTADSASKPYDGSALTKDHFEISSGSLVSGHSVSADVNGSQTKVGSSANSIVASSVTVTDQDGNDVTEYYSFTLVDGTLTVEKSDLLPAITVTMEGASKTYDGSPLTSDKYSITSGALESGETLKLIKTIGEQTDVGTGSVTAEFAVYAGDKDVSDNYNIKVVAGTLTVEQRKITLTADSATKTYDGKALEKKSFAVTSGELVGGHKISADVKGSQTEIGSSPNRIDSKSVKITDSKGNDVTGNYAVTLEDGTLTVEKAPEKPVIVITVKDAEKVYDGTALTAKDYSITSGKLEKGDKLQLVKFSGSQTDIGSSGATAEFRIKNGKTDVTDKYTVTVSEGRLTVKPRAITVTADSASKTYDGKALEKKSFTVTSGSVAEGQMLAANVKGSQTEVGSSANSIDPTSVKITDSKGNEVTANYSITLKDGTLSVEKAPEKPTIEITVKSVKKTYDGKALKAEEYHITGGALVDGDSLKLVKMIGSQTDVGESEATAEFKIVNGKKNVTEKYSVTVVPGKLTVSARGITLTAASSSKIYDGSPLAKNSFKISSGKLVKGHIVKATVTGSQTELGSSANVIDKNTIKITDSKGKDVTANYNVSTVPGTLSVTKNPITDITLSVGTHSKIYDGKPYTFSANDVQVISGEKLPAGYTVQATFNPENPVDAGKYDVIIKSVFIRDAQGNDVTTKYNISRVKGSLEITQRPITIETKAANKVFDGTPLTERSTPTITGRADGHQITLRITGSQTKVGSSENTVTDVKITDKVTGEDVTKNYAITYKYGLLTVSASDSGENEYIWFSGSDGTLFFRLDHNYDGFEGIQVDGRDVDKSGYTSASGSTEIWLKASFLNKLSVGRHTLCAKYSDGETSKVDFIVKSSGSSKTGDSSNALLWFVIMAIALAAAIAAGVFLLRNRKSGRGKGRHR